MNDQCVWSDTAEQCHSHTQRCVWFKYDATTPYDADTLEDIKPPIDHQLRGMHDDVWARLVARNIMFPDDWAEFVSGLKRRMRK